MSDAALPAPLVPADVDLRDFGFMPLDVQRLRDSDLATVATGDEFRAAVLVWCAAWHQVPASSVPDDDRWLAKHSGGGPRWKKLKTEALRGFVLCADGRMYHWLVAEKAAEGWNAKLEAEHKRACDRMRKTNHERKDRNEEALPMPSRPHLLSMRVIDGFPCWRAWNSDGTVVNSGGNSNGIPSDCLRKSRLKGSEGKLRDSKGTGTVKGEVQQPLTPTPVTAPASRPRTRDGSDGKGLAVWEAYAAAYLERWHTEPVRNASVNAMLSRLVDRVGSEEAPQIAAFFVGSNKAAYVSARHPVKMLLADAEGLRTQWATNRASTQTAALQADRTAAQGDVFRELKQEYGYGG